MLREVGRMATFYMLKYVKNNCKGGKNMDNTRRIYLDNIRWITVCIVVIYHVIYMYNGVQPFGVIGPFKEQQLQDAGCSQRQGKQDDLLQHGAAGQIACPGILCHENALPPQISDGTHEKTRRSTASDADSIIIRFQVKYK